MLRQILAALAIASCPCISNGYIKRDNEYYHKDVGYFYTDTPYIVDSGEMSSKGALIGADQKNYYDDTKFAEKIIELYQTLQTEEFKKFANTTHTSPRWFEVGLNPAFRRSTNYLFDLRLLNFSKSSLHLLDVLTTYSYFKSINALLYTKALNLNFALGWSSVNYNKKDEKGNIILFYFAPFCGILEFLVSIADESQQQAIYDVLRSHGAKEYTVNFDDKEIKEYTNEKFQNDIKAIAEAFANLKLNKTKDISKPLYFTDDGKGSTDKVPEYLTGVVLKEKKAEEKKPNPPTPPDLPKPTDQPKLDPSLTEKSETWQIHPFFLRWTKDKIIYFIARDLYKNSFEETANVAVDKDGKIVEDNSKTVAAAKTLTQHALEFYVDKCGIVSNALSPIGGFWVKDKKQFYALFDVPSSVTPTNANTIDLYTHDLPENAYNQALAFYASRDPAQISLNTFASSLYMILK